MPTLPITVPNVFANATSNIALSLLDADFLAVAQAINGIGNGSTPLTNVTITGGSVSGVVVSSVPTSGQCRLTYISATQIRLDPYNGQYIQIAGTLYAIPAAGITVGNGGVAPNNAFFVYVYNNAGTLALEISATGYVTDTTPGNIGIRIKSGDSSRSLVGQILSNNEAQFGQGTFDTTGAMTFGVYSWFNRQTYTTGTNISGTLNATPTGIAPAIRAFPWSEEAVQLLTTGYAHNTGTADTMFMNMRVNGATTGSQIVVTLPAGAYGGLVNVLQSGGGAAFTVQPYGNSGGQPMACTGTFWLQTRL